MVRFAIVEWKGGNTGGTLTIATMGAVVEIPLDGEEAEKLSHLFNQGEETIDR